MKKTFKCICSDYLLEIEYNNTMERANLKTKKKIKQNIPKLWIGIYEIHNKKTGRKLKKPKLVGDVLFTGEDYNGKELDFIMKFLEKITMKYTLRRQ